MQINQLYEFTLEISRGGERCELPAGTDGAHVVCFSAAPEYQAAITQAVHKLAAQHFVFVGVEGKVRELPAAMWTEYVDKVWPELAGHFPDAAELPALIDIGAVFFGPFLCFQAPPPAPAPAAG